MGSPWAGELADVPGINDKPFRTILAALRQMRAGGKGTSIVLTGEPGSGKTHLLGRLRDRLLRDEREDKGETIYVYVRCNASAGTLWRHLRHALASDLLKGSDGTQLHELFERIPDRMGNVAHAGVRRALESIRDGRHFHIASAWLRGEALGDEDLAALGMALADGDEDNSRERDARLVVEAVLRFLAPTPAVLCFDQVEALETYPGEEAGYLATAQMVSDLYDGHDHLLLISCIVAAFENRFDRIPNGALKDRWLQFKDTLRPIDWDQAVELVKARLDTAIPLQNLRGAHTADPLWPLDAEGLRPLFAETGLCLPRTLIRACERQFAELLNDEEPMPPEGSREEFIEEQYERALGEARVIAKNQGAAKTLSDCLPWLLQNSGMTPLGQDRARAIYAQQAWRGPDGDLALAFCDGRGNALTNQIRRIESNWLKAPPELAILRDSAIQPGPAGTRYLEQLKQRGAREINPLPEALAVLQAIRNISATARSGEFFFGAEPVSEEEVTDWALASLPPQVEELRAALTRRRSSPPPSQDRVLSGLSELVSRRKIIAADQAAAELPFSAEEVRDCARRHPMRFGILDGPPVVVFEAVEGPAR